MFFKFRITAPPSVYPTSRESASGSEYLLNKPLQRALSELARRSALTLPEFVELRHSVRTPNHGSAHERINILRKNIRKEQDAWRCLVLDANLLDQWPEVVISPFGVVDKGGEDSKVSGRTIHDLSYPEGASVNEYTDQDSITKPDYTHCDAVSREILKAKNQFPDADICIMAGDVATAFRNISIHSNSVYLFAGRIEEEGVLIIELSAPFGLTGSPGFYEIFGGAISYVHGSHANHVSPNGFFSYHWMDDHINVFPNIGLACNEMDRSLRYAMAAVLGSDAINTENFTNWSTRQRVLGLEFDSEAEQVSLPDTKIIKTRRIVGSAYSVKSLCHKAYRSLMGSLRHVATCIRAARPFLQRLCQRESHLHRFLSVPVSKVMKDDLLWWRMILHTSQLNGVSLEFFNTLPPPDVVIEMDASDFGLCALDTSAHVALTHMFTASERHLIS
ncbi:hypothetical protein F443_16067 [Phytophthora nicotianae P1569]|uniref:Uncharacterized protein n=1 Tax=Phytophthora nicotianae P1569 TaxID=1317065 RepID=V9EFV9_PHYNI|nr:hypothetical protein F443_16067 [Phytophthora nicotianae P1569]